MPEAVVNDAEVGLITTSTGTTDAAGWRPAARARASVVLVAVLLIAQYPARPSPGPRTTTWPGTLPFVAM